MPKKKPQKTASTSSPKPLDLSNRFVSGVVEWVDPNTLKDNPDNWRLHPEEQLQALEESFSASGIVVPVLLNSQSGNLIDGHGRKQAAIRAKKLLPILRVNVSDEEEKFLLGNLDPIAQMATFQTKALKQITASQEGFLSSLKKKDALQGLNNRLGSLATLASVGKSELNVFKQVDKLEKRREVRQKDSQELSLLPPSTDIELPCDEEWGIPLLNEKGPFCESPPTITWTRNSETACETSWVCLSCRPFAGFQESAREKRASIFLEQSPSILHDWDRPKAGILGFFTEDNRFNAAYDDPVSYGAWLVSGHWLSVCEPDYSIYHMDSDGNQYPFARAIWALYRSRWCAAYWQSLGIPVLPQLRWSSNDYLHNAMIDTLPKALPWLVVHLRASLASRPTQEIESVGRGLMEATEATSPKGLIFYGDPKLEGWVRDYMPKKPPKLVFIQDYANARGKEIRK